MSEKSTGKVVSYSIDLDNPPPFTEEEKAQLDRLRLMKDEDIDRSDIPSQAGKGGWSRPGRLQDAIAKRIEERKAATVRLEEDVLTFFSEAGEVSSPRINAALREYMQSHRKSA